jgi:autophagy-related protein 2
MQGQSRRDHRTEFDINFLMVRVQIRCPSPPSLLQRSGAAILDVHHLKLTSCPSLGTGEIYPRGVDSKAESTSRDSSSRNNHLLVAEWRTLLLACSPAGAETARGFCSIGPLSLATDSEVPAVHDHIRFRGDASPIRRFSFVKLSQNPPSSSGQRSGRSAALIAEIDIPSIVLTLSKPLFDSLQFWIDDVTQLLERTVASSSNTTQDNPSRNPSLVGSRFFSGSKQSSVEIAVDETSPENVRSSTESVIKVTISEGECLLISISLVLIRHSLHETLNSSE